MDTTLETVERPDPDTVDRSSREARSTGTRLGPVFAEGHGAWLTAVDGTDYFDATAGSGAVSLGHQHPAVVDAVVAQARRLGHTGCKLGSDVREEMTAQLAALVPFEDARVLPTATGSEAIEAALKVARAATGRNSVVALDRSFHGKTAGALALTWRQSLKEHSGPAPQGIWRIDPPDPRAGDDNGAAEQQARSLIARAAATGDLAAVVIEPVQVTEGVLELPVRYIDAVADEARKAGALVVIDEIYTGLGRCGRLFRSELLSHTPDLIVLGKTLGNGSPIAAVTGPAAVLDALPAGVQTSTFSGNPVSCAAAVAVLDVVVNQDVPARARELGEYLREHGQESMREFEWIRDWRVVGGLAGFDCIDSAGQPSPSLARAFTRAALAERLLLFSGGPQDASVKIVPSLMMSQADLRRLTDLLDATSRRISEGV
ncbi:aspartate aminotransferase family protein [Rhodococcus tibetensis]|uniref:Aspartate aminotransferase family protein n=1 Tax=Rhodococcus tibetensis TaxID=2965064 RepID=A0ABT1QJC9_9NOCA|nr:aspartate aminotransferase family protein [Rhodococcus sp. FXJ9.536]MCQ4122373.1 aspartate aminotransferase family protein [Rhodococcus sp. FXJ9.536]